MLNRDFSKSNKDYFFKNRIVISITVAFLVIGILIASFFGLKSNFEFKGYNEFYVTVGSELSSSDYNKYSNTIEQIINEYNAKFDSIAVFDEGDNTRLVVRYLSNINEENKNSINNEISSQLNIELTMISNHSHVGSSINSTDYIFTAVTILLILVVATIFAYVRYNGVAAITILISNVLGILGFISLDAILRITIGSSIFAMLVILNVLICYLCLNLFEFIKEDNYLKNKDYAKAISSAMQKSRSRICFVSIALFVVGVLFVLFAAQTLKYVALNILFMAVSLIATMLYVVPFIWSVFVTYSSVRKGKSKDSTVKSDNNEMNDKTETILNETDLSGDSSTGSTSIGG